MRRFAPRPIPDDVLADVLEVARWTGSSKNTQPWDLVLVRDRATLERLSTLGRYAGHVADAAAAVVLAMRERSLTAALDEGRLAQNLMLAAWAHGVGACIATVYPEEAVEALLDLPHGRWVHTAISLGYPSDPGARRVSGAPPATRAILPAGRRPLSQVVHWERYGNPRRRRPLTRRGRSGGGASPLRG